ncbi:MAG: helix-turn-helix domain-containing protein [Proteobacteria bacterium]|nr:hypothetical protein [Desulfocapsa sp.]MBU3943585.1 helix-turn-helix domain-containing protein [Pseudomonadota bacterium]MCG2743855.1 helix-turn-helix domain-containing protein [Desulfobacteraceae bacterium]MBU3982354.1 helix-turn-helix domain-containing protein [Pseudomonadota bacterium]MBU4028247.1 helix-turn-helix domain-containing protein [Pseudomonadota bacterium]
MENKKAATPTLERNRLENQKNFTTNSLEHQREAILSYLRAHGSMTTLEARRNLDVLHPAGRVAEIRRAGIEIDLVWCVDLSENGRPHKVGRYILAGGA